MFDDEMHIELAIRLRAMNRVLARIVPDSSTEAVEATIEIMLEAVARREVAEAVAALEDMVGADPYWLRGYLLLDTIQNDSDDMNGCFGIGWRCFRSAAAISTKPLNSGPPSKKCIVHKEGRTRNESSGFRGQCRRHHE